MTRSLFRQIDASHRQIVRAALGITWPETISTAELTQRAKLIPLSRTIRKRRLRLVGHVIRMQLRCQTPLGTLMTTVPSNRHLRQGHGRTSTLQHNVSDDLRSINCDVISISEVTNSSFVLIGRNVSTLCFIDYHYIWSLCWYYLVCSYFNVPRHGYFLVFCYGLWMMFSRCLTCLNPIMLTFIPVRNCGYTYVSFQVVVGSQFWAHIQYMGHSFIGFLTHALFEVLIYSKYLCLVILSVESLV